MSSAWRCEYSRLADSRTRPAKIISDHLVTLQSNPVVSCSSANPRIAATQMTMDHSMNLTKCDTRGCYLDASAVPIDNSTSRSHPLSLFLQLPLRTRCNTPRVFRPGTLCPARGSSRILSPGPLPPPAPFRALTSRGRGGERGRRRGRVRLLSS